LTRAVQGTVAAQNSSSTCFYDDNDWPTSLSSTTNGQSSTTSYLYDKNGSQVRKTTGGQSTAQVWDFEGHLMARASIDAGGAWTGTRQVNSFDAATWWTALESEQCRSPWSGYPSFSHRRPFVRTSSRYPKSPPIKRGVFSQNLFSKPFPQITLCL